MDFMQKCCIALYIKSRYNYCTCWVYISTYVKEYECKKNNKQEYLGCTDKKSLPVLNLFSHMFHTFLIEERPLCFRMASG